MGATASPPRRPQGWRGYEGMSLTYQQQSNNTMNPDEQKGSAPPPRCGGVSVLKQPMRPVPSLHRPAKKSPFYSSGCFIIALLCFALAAGLFAHAQYKQQAWLRAEGVVVENVAQTSSSRKSRGTSYYARVRFEAEDGRAYVLRQHSPSNPPDFKVGESVTVLYPAGRPLDGVIHTPWELYVWCGIAAFCGLAFLLSTCLHRLAGERANKQHGSGQ